MPQHYSCASPCRKRKVSFLRPYCDPISVLATIELEAYAEYSLALLGSYPGTICCGRHVYHVCIELSCNRQKALTNTVSFKRKERKNYEREGDVKRARTLIHMNAPRITFARPISPVQVDQGINSSGVFAGSMRVHLGDPALWMLHDDDLS